ncbi:MAG TPA: RNA pyrophosphohydrolase [Lacipirellulaceae bacterium]|nr:RNA pyrophosphohydrolase [Lacipirellulaceae bacterium]
MKHEMPDTKSAGHLPLRDGVGIVLLNAKRQIWIGQRRPRWYMKNGGSIWQFPQGGINPGETPVEAARRELFEETNIRNADMVAESVAWLTYEVPTHALGLAMKGRFRGQRQRWFLMQYDGRDRDIDITGRRNRMKPEFQAWRWSIPEEFLPMSIEHKREVYAEVLAEFERWLRP